MGIYLEWKLRKKQGKLVCSSENFHKMELPDYEWGINEIMQDKDYLYKTMTRDLFFSGKSVE